MKKTLERIRNDIIENDSVAPDILLKIPRITVIGLREITIENHKGIRKFEDKFIEINSKVGVIRIEGKDFEILYIGSQTIIVSGEFKAIKYEEKVLWLIKEK